MLDFLFSSLWGWIGISGVIIIILAAVAWFIPGLRLIALEIAAGIVAATSIYAKGASDRAKLEEKRKEQAVKKAQEDYDKIDSRPDTKDTVDKRLRDGTF